MKTEHYLPFEVADWNPSLPMANTEGYKRFRVGTCHGLWCATDQTYDILAVDNEQPGNGHLNDVFQWFENSCIRDKKSLRVLEIMNGPFYHHLVKKRGFSPIDPMNVIKRFDLKSRLKRA